MRQVRSAVPTLIALLTLSAPNLIAAPSWTPVSGTLGQPREMPAMIALSDGRVLVIGGTGPAGISSAVDSYDPATNAMTAAAPMTVGRVFMGATRLNDGRVLVTGGQSDTGFTSTTEIFDPATNAWTSAADLPYVAFALRAVTLTDGRVLVVGGASDTGFLRSTALYSPATNSWTVGPSMANARELPEAVTLTDGRVLVTGGFSDDAAMSALAAAEVFNPSSSSWSAAGATSVGHALGFAVRLQDGRVMVGGGVSNGSFDQIQGTVDVYDPQTGQWRTAASMAKPRVYVSAGVLPSGTVLVSGGLTGLTPAFTMSDDVEAYSPSQDAWQPFAPLSAAKFASGAAVSGSRFIVAGGASDVATFDTAEMTEVAPMTAVASVVGPSTVKGVAGSLAAVVVSAEGSSGASGPRTFTWTEGATVLATTTDPTRTATLGLGIGVHALTLDVSDGHGNSASATVTVTVEDAMVPLSTQVTQLSNQLQQALLQLGVARQQVTTLQAQLAASQAQIAAEQKALARLVDSIQSFLQVMFHDKNFRLPGLTPVEKLTNLVQAMSGMPGSGRDYLYRVLRSWRR